MQTYNETWVFLPPPPKPGKEWEEQDGKHNPDERGQRVKIIVVDDEPQIADTLVEILSGEGFEAVTASTGNEAIELAQTFRPDIVISDVVMPGLDGVEASIRIRDLLPECRVILFSGQADTVDLLKKARDRGHEFEIVAKPIKPETLLSIIRGQTPSGGSGLSH